MQQSPAPPPPRAGLYVGLISGTSADGIDAALVLFDDDGHCRLQHAETFPWDTALRARLVQLGQGGDVRSLDEIAALDVRVGEAFALAAQALLQGANVAPSQIVAIGSHGQTVRHRPAGALHDGQHPFSLQIGDANVIAERCAITTVADFRRRDIAAGGQGAPLVPAFHAAMLHAIAEDRAVLNLGGIGNFTLLPARGEVRGFDTGPANALLDAWCERHTGRAFDASGEFAASGTVDDALLARLLGDAWFTLPPPKSSGREQFHLDWVQPHLLGSETAADVQATLLELSAATIAQALLDHLPTTRRVLTCGGGVRNPRLIERISARLPDCIVEPTDAHGLDADFVEAMAFAWLARQTLAGLPGNVASVTGARGARVLGAIYPG